MAKSFRLLHEHNHQSSYSASCLLQSRKLSLSCWSNSSAVMSLSHSGLQVEKYKEITTFHTVQSMTVSRSERLQDKYYYEMFNIVFLKKVSNRNKPARNPKEMLILLLSLLNCCSCFPTHKPVIVPLSYYCCVKFFCKQSYDTSYM